MKLKTDQFQLTTLFEDDDLIIFNKPSGIVVNDSRTAPGETIQGWLSAELHQSDADWQASEASWHSLVPADFSGEYGSPLEIWRDRQGMVHRLDKQTSGILVWAKNPGSLVNLLAQFRTRQIQKYYQALVHGKVLAPKATLSFPLGRASQDRKMFAVQPDGRPAVTEYQVLKVFAGLKPEAIQTVLWPKIEAKQTEGVHFFKTLTQFQKRVETYQGFSLLECHPLTGRTHQIRVHLAHIQHPIVGDETYVGKKRHVIDSLWCSRHFLHAEKIILTHPRTGAKLEITAPLPPDLAESLSLLETL